MNIINSYISEFFNLLNEMSPYLLFGFLIAGILHVVMPNERVAKYLGGSNFKSVFNASMFGVPLPLCSCGVIPTGLSFYKNGASKGSAVSFLISTPQTGVDSILATYSLLGLPFAILRPFIALVTGIFGGLLTIKLNNGANVTVPVTPTAAAKPRNTIMEIFRYAFIEFMEDIAKWLLIGIVIAALISVLIPDGFFTAYLGNDLLSMLLVLVAAVPLYVCATGSIPIAAVLIMKGLSPGAALVFLMAGPATNIATITLVGKVMGRKTLFAYLFSIVAGALLFGFIINQFLPREWFTTMASHNHSHSEMLPLWLQTGSSIILGIFIIIAFWRKWKNKNQEEPTNKSIGLTKNMEIKVIKVQGMNCNHCKATVEKGIREIPGVKEVDINLQQEKVTISADNIDLDTIKNAVEGLGYRYAGEV
jgi:uncharacterized membrane protein YraQ (UPF0718 family)/copper chaperone CopZ